MKKADFIKKLSEMAKVDVTTMTAALASDKEDIDIELPEVHSFTDEELTDRDKNMAKAGNTTYLKQTIGFAKNKLKETHGEEFDFVEKTIDNLLDAAIRAGEKKAGVEPTKQIQEKDKMIKALQDTVKTLETEKDSAVKDKDQFKFNYAVDSTLVKKVPFIENSTFSPDELVTMWKAQNEPVELDGIITYKKNGEVARDPKTQNPIPADSGFESWLTEKGFTKAAHPGGRGEKDKNPPSTGGVSGIKTTEDLDAYCEKNNISSLDGKKAVLMEVIKNNPGFILGES